MPNLVKIIQYLRGSLIIDRQTRKFIRHNKIIWSGYKVKCPDSVVLTDLYPVNETIISYSYFLNILAKRHNAQVKSFGRRRKIPDFRLHKVYRSFNAYEHIAISLDKEQRLRSNEIFNQVFPGLNTRQDIFDLHIQGVWIGIDIYESYLKEENKPTVFLNDRRLAKIIKCGIDWVIFWKDYFAKNNVAAVVVSHDAYVYFDIICKIAYQAHVPVYLPNIRGLFLSKEPFSVYSYFNHYRSKFAKLTDEEKKNGIALAKKQLERRLNGEIGVDMHYSTRSAFHWENSRKRVLRKNEKIKVLICSHCFFDNPHGYGGMLFLDFYEWLRYLGRISERTDYDWYLKVHPDPLPGTLETIQQILADFPRITIIPHETSHHQLFKEGINFVLTVYGSIAHEYPILGVQVINAGHNPHIAYDFNWNPKSLAEYEYYLLNLDKLEKTINLEDIYEFYYMHYYYAIADGLFLHSYRQYLLDLPSKKRNSSLVFKYFLNQLTDSRHQQIIHKVQAFIDSGRQYYFKNGPE